MNGRTLFILALLIGPHLPAAENTCARKHKLEAQASGFEQRPLIRSHSNRAPSKSTPAVMHPHSGECSYNSETTSRRFSICNLRLAAANPVDAGRDALQSRPDYPWYDEDTDDVRRVDVKAEKPPPQARDWELDEDYDSSSTGGGNVGASAGFWAAMMWLFWILIGLILLGLIAAMIFAFMKNDGSSDSTYEGQKIIEPTIERVEDLPFHVRRPKSDLLTEARRLYEAGDYNEAIIYFYSYQLVELDRNQLIRLERGKTNRQYMREIHRQPPLHGLVQPTMFAFEDVFFGDHTLSRARFEKCFLRLDDFQNRILEAAV